MNEESAIMPRFSARVITAVFGVLLAAALAPDPARAQASVSRVDDGLRFTLTVDKLVYGYVDTVHVSYGVENVSDAPETLMACCCGIEFFAVRDSACALEDPDCQVAGCDACDVCQDDLACRFDPCDPLPIPPGEFWEFTWDWDRVICPRDVGFPDLGNVGTYRIVVGYAHCEFGDIRSVLSIPIEILTSAPGLPSSWGGVKALHSGRDRPVPPAGQGDS